MEMQMPYLPRELIVSLILPRLPVRSLLRFRCVCQAWRDTIDDDECFPREHLRLQNQCMLIAPQTVIDQNEGTSWARKEIITTTGLYRWDKGQQGQGVATLVHAMQDCHSFPPREARHGLAHCDGLVLLPTEETLRVLNPATRRISRLPWSHHITVPRAGHGLLWGHQAFGLGHDPLSNTYKVVRFFYRSINRLDTGTRDAYHNLIPGMEIFTVGVDKRWHETATPPPYPIMLRRTATFCKGSLFWTIEKSLLGDNPSMPGFVRLYLEDESFGVVPPPPCCSPTLNYAPRLAELRGELCLAHSGNDDMSLEIWMCNNLDDNLPRWDQRYAIALDFAMSSQDLRPVAMFDNEIVFHVACHILFRYNYQSGKCITRGDMIGMHDLMYVNPDNDDTTDMLVEYTRSNVFDAIPYIPSLVPV